jgi:hypothetical protein
MLKGKYNAEYICEHLGVSLPWLWVNAGVQKPLQGSNFNSFGLLSRSRNKPDKYYMITLISESKIAKLIEAEGKLSFQEL